MLEISYSALSAWRRCKQSYYYRYVVGIAPIVTKAAMEVGSIFHAVLSDYHCLPVTDRTPSAMSESLNNRIQLSNLTGEQEYEQRPLLMAMAVGFQKAFGNDSKIPQLKLGVTSEATFRKELICGVNLNGVTDGRFRVSGEPWILEHKTGASPDLQYFSLLDEQGALYCWATGSVGVCYTFIQQPRSKEQSKSERLYVERTSLEIELAYQDACITAKEMLFTTEIGRSRGMHCSWCDYKPICIVVLTGGNEQDVIEENYKTVKPEWMKEYSI